MCPPQCMVVDEGDDCDISSGLSESTTYQWSGGADINDGKLQKAV